MSRVRARPVLPVCAYFGGIRADARLKRIVFPGVHFRSGAGNSMGRNFYTGELLRADGKKKTFQLGVSCVSHWTLIKSWCLGSSSGSVKYWPEEVERLWALICPDQTRVKLFLYITCELSVFELCTVNERLSLGYRSDFRLLAWKELLF